MASHPGRFECGKCHKTFTLKRNLTRHTKLHEGPKFACSWEGCTKVFSRQTDREIHHKGHKGQRDFVCKHPKDPKSRGVSAQLCGKRFLRQSDLNVHIRRHTADRPFQCPGCAKQFVRRCDLAVHLRRCRATSRPGSVFEHGAGVLKNDAVMRMSSFGLASSLGMAGSVGFGDAAGALGGSGCFQPGHMPIVNASNAIEQITQMAWEGQRQLFVAQHQAPDTGMQLALQSQAYQQQWSQCGDCPIANRLAQRALPTIESYIDDQPQKPADVPKGNELAIPKSAPVPDIEDLVVPAKTACCMFGCSGASLCSDMANLLPTKQLALESEALESEAAPVAHCKGGMAETGDKAAGNRPLTPAHVDVSSSAAQRDQLSSHGEKSPPAYGTAAWKKSMHAKMHAQSFADGSKAPPIDSIGSIPSVALAFGALPFGSAPVGSAATGDPSQSESDAEPAKVRTVRSTATVASLVTSSDDDGGRAKRSKSSCPGDGSRCAQCNQSNSCNFLEADAIIAALKEENAALKSEVDTLTASRSLVNIK